VKTKPKPSDGIELKMALNALWVQAGKPSIRFLARRCDMRDTDMQSALRGGKLPPWPQIEKIVTRLGGDVEHFHALWTKA